ncbi:hypothetical protein KAR91_52275 [Candidatus Pacearchaeota archaeon]|nr:hypothetical protein [Candidatus Pacearchaeota archaeon]
MNMKQIWQKKLNELDELISNVEIGKDGILTQLYQKRELLEKAMGDVGK